MKTCSLKLAQELQKAGYPQDTYFHWQRGEEPFDNTWVIVHTDFKQDSSLVPAPTADEILERLPCVTDQEWFLVSKNPLKEEWFIDWNTKSKMFRGESFADACADFWLYLKQNNLLK